MTKVIIMILFIVMVSCKEQNYKESIYKPYSFNIESKCTASMRDSILVLKYYLKNLDTVNYYLPGSIILFSGNADTNYSISSAPGDIFAHHNINYFPINAKLSAVFELNAKYLFSNIPYFYKILPNDVFELNIEILPLVQSEDRILNNFNLKMDYSIQTRFALINEIDLRVLLSRLNLNNIKSSIIVDSKNLSISTNDKELIKKIQFETTNFKIDSTKSELLNDYLQNFIEVQGKLINTK